MKNHQRYKFLAVTIFATLLAACGGGSSDEAAVPDPASAATPASSSSAGGTTTLVTTTCIPAPELPSKYSRVFKGCDSAGVAQYYELDECVRDNTTGLIWQGQTPAGTGLRANDQRKTNYDSIKTLQKKTASGFVVPTLAEVNDISNSIGFKNAINSANLCGSNSWRLPTRLELNGLAKFDEIPRIDSTMFVNMPAQYFAFWTSADSRSPYFPANSAAIGVDFGDGYLPSELLYTEYFRTSHLLVRLVH